MPLAHIIEINALTVDGVAGPLLSARWSWASSLLDEEDVRALAECWFGRCALWCGTCLRRRGRVGARRGDLPLVDLSQGEERAAGEPLTGRSRTFCRCRRCRRACCSMRSTMRRVPTSIRSTRRSSLTGAWTLRCGSAAEAVLQRHANLRAAFRHENLNRPVQVVLPSVPPLLWRSIDLSLLDDAARRGALAAAAAGAPPPIAPNGSILPRRRSFASPWCGSVRSSTGCC